jgi:hypothetical protein
LFASFYSLSHTRKQPVVLVDLPPIARRQTANVSASVPAVFEKGGGDESREKPRIIVNRDHDDERRRCLFVFALFLCLHTISLQHTRLPTYGIPLLALIRFFFFLFVVGTETSTTIPVQVARKTYLKHDLSIYLHNTVIIYNIFFCRCTQSTSRSILYFGKQAVITSSRTITTTTTSNKQYYIHCSLSAAAL